MSRAVLYDYFRSSAAYRVRIALNLKGVDYEQRSINLAEGAQRSDEFLAINPQGLVPMLEIDGHRLTQSLSIIMYLSARFPEPPLLPANPAEAAHVRAMALSIACDIHPLNNLRVLKYLKGPLGVSDAQKDEWYGHWVREGLAALDVMATPAAGRYLWGDEPTIADVCLVPQMYNARRFGVTVDDFPTLTRADENAQVLEPFARAHPDRQEQPL